MKKYNYQFFILAIYVLSAPMHAEEDPWGPPVGPPPKRPSTPSVAPAEYRRAGSVALAAILMTFAPSEGDFRLLFEGCLKKRHLLMKSPDDQALVAKLYNELKDGLRLSEETEAEEWFEIETACLKTSGVRLYLLLADLPQDRLKPFPLFRVIDKGGRAFEFSIIPPCGEWLNLRNKLRNL